MAKSTNPRVIKALTAIEENVAAGEEHTPEDRMKILEPLATHPGNKTLHRGTKKAMAFKRGGKVKGYAK